MNRSDSNTGHDSNVIAYIALGANLGKPTETVIAAIDALAKLAEQPQLQGTRIVAVSSLYRTAPVGLKHQPDFINAVVALETPAAAGPHKLLDALFAIEGNFGRQRSIPNAARTLDLDLLLYGDCILGEAHLTLPHPRMHQRAFVLAPLLEVAPDYVIPGHGPVRTLLEACHGQSITRLPGSHTSIRS